jgi:glutamate synthase (NADPH/NADH) small chain
MTCLNPRCQEAGCPLQNQVPVWLELYHQDKLEQACEVLHESNNFPEFTSIVCPAFCQDQCKKALNGQPVQVQDVEREIIETAWREGWVTPAEPAEKTGQSVAVIGSGPAGLAAAQQLVRMGHDVTVFERDESAGGLLRYGIPAHRLDKKLIDRRLEQLQAEGVRMRTGVAIGHDISAESIREQFDAVCLATGASQPVDLDVPGRHEVAGVHFALDFLRQENCKVQGAYASEAGRIDPKDKVVAVIGAGLTGEDCVETALAGGAREVYQVEIRPEQLVAGNGGNGSGGNGHDQANSEKVHRNWCVATRQFKGDSEHLTEMECVPVDWTPSSSGPVMRPHDEKPFKLKTDLALLACGFRANVERDVIEQLGLRTDSAGRIMVEDQAAVNADGVFLAGDVVNGASYVATAIHSGRQAADRIAQYLKRKA